MVLAFSSRLSSSLLLTRFSSTPRKRREATVMTAFITNLSVSAARNTLFIRTSLPSSCSRITSRHLIRLRTAHHECLRMSSTTPSPDSPAISAEITPDRKFHTVRTAMFAAMALTYAAYVFLRATFTYVAPVMADHLSFSLQSIGKITSAFPIAYGMSRLLTGVVVDRTLPHIALAVGLLLAGLVNITMGTATSVAVLALLWALNGLVQGVGAGSTAKMLTSWFSRKERGLFWALWSTSANVGGFLAPIVCGWLAASAAGFRAGLMIPGAFAVVLALLIVPLVKSTPKDAGFQVPWETEEVAKKEAASWKEAFVEGVVKNKIIWALAVAYFFVYLVRSGTKSWLHFWLLDTRGVDASEAAYRVSGMEIGGIAGTFSAGVVSDWADGRRIAVTIGYLIGAVISIYTAWLIPGGKPLWDFLVISVIGFMINGPQMIIGLVGAEVSDKRVVATATGVLGWISYLGAAASGFPLSVVIKRFGWAGFFAALLASTGCSILCLAPLHRLQGESSK